MDKFIIGIAGIKGAGKDTLAQMINYILTEGTSNANYIKCLQKSLKPKFNRVIHFADNLKDVLSIIYNIPREYFDIREFKDSYWYCFEERRFLKPEDCKSEYYPIDISDLMNIIIKNEGIFTNPLANILKDNKKHIIQLRTLLQYFGTNVCRQNLGYNIWVDSCMAKANDICFTNNYCMIADVRFKEEAEAIRKSSLYGVLIRVNRGDNNKSEHISEKIDFDCDIVIDNNSSKLNLYYKALEIVQNLIRK